MKAADAHSRRLTGADRVPADELAGWTVTDGAALVMAEGATGLLVWVADVAQGQQIPQVVGAPGIVLGAPSALINPTDSPTDDTPVVDAAAALLADSLRTEHKKEIISTREAQRSDVEGELGRLANLALTGHSEIQLGDTHRGSAWACAKVCQLAGHQVDVDDLGECTTRENARKALSDLGITTRQVRIDERWLNAPSEPAIVFGESGALAMAPRRSKMLPIGYPDQVVDVDQLEPYALEVVRPLSPEGPVANLRVAISIGVKRAVSIMLWALLAATSALPLPIGNALIFGFVLPSGDSQRLWVTGASLFLLIVIATLGTAQLVRRLSNTRAYGEYRMQLAVHAKALKLPVNKVGLISRGELVARILAATLYGGYVFTREIAALAIATFSLTSLTLMFVAGPIVGLAGLVVVAASVALGLWSWFRSRSASRQEVIANRAQESAVTDALGAIDAVKTTAAEDRMLLRLGTSVGQSVSASYRSNYVAGQASTYLAVLGTLATALVVGAVWWQGPYEVTVADFTLAMAALAQATSAGALAGAVIPRLAAGERELDQTSLIINADAERHRGHKRSTLSGGIRLVNARVEVSDDLPPILDGVSLEIEPGEFLAIVGPSGAGKSTLVRTILGFEKLSGGSVFFDDDDAKKLDIENVRSQIGVVLQKPKLFDGTLRFNVALGRDLSDDQIVVALTSAGADDILRSFDNGLDTMINSDTAISGGQRQRIAIARAIVNEPAILVLDEATSALDNASQAAVTAAIDALGATRLVIAHRFSTIRNADRVVVVDAGRIVEMGTVDELLAHEGLFAAMASRQLIDAE